LGEAEAAGVFVTLLVQLGAVPTHASLGGGGSVVPLEAIAIPWL
jgi:hypothetical protein